MIFIKKDNTIKLVLLSELKPNDEIICIDNKTCKIIRIIKGGKNGN